MDRCLLYIITWANRKQRLDNGQNGIDELLYSLLGMDLVVQKIAAAQGDELTRMHQELSVRIAEINRGIQLQQLLG